MNATRHQSDAVAALISGALANPHLPATPTPDQAAKVLPWLKRETDHPITWEIDTTHRTSVFLGRIHATDADDRRDAITAWARVIGSWSIAERAGELSAIGRYQGFSVEITATGDRAPLSEGTCLDTNDCQCGRCRARLAEWLEEEAAK
ncbi:MULTISPECIES: hypothetical protein [unclassified Nocardiopsis]|uniref:hypothetical protein n=1 Tax=Nocardiopsis TaxID=2013 RepID=UPI00387AFC77